MTLGGKLALCGLVLTLIGAGILAASGPVPRSPAALQGRPAAGVVGLGILLLVLGCFVYVLEPAFEAQAASHVSPATVRTSLAMLVAAVATANLISLPLLLAQRRPIGAGGSPGGSLGPLGLTYLVAGSEIPIIAVVWLRLVLPGAMSWRQLGLRLRPLGEHAWRGLTGGIALFLTAAVVGAVLTRFGVHQNQFERFQGVEHAPLGLFLLALAAGCLLAPFAEELFFRGYVFQTFSERYGRIWSYLFSAGLFAVVHANLAAAVPIFVLGLMLAYIFQRSGSIVPGIIAHGLNNAISFVLLYSGITG